MRIIGLSAFLVVSACAHDVKQDAHSGADAKIKGARPVALVDGEGRASGIVTYPGGDRVDWKRIVLPPGKHGTLDLQLTWQAPRPGLQVAMDVFDQWSTPIVAQAVHHKHTRTRSTQIDHARGDYFVRIYAPGRGDAGAYKLHAIFAEDPVPIVPNIAELDIAAPPRLPAVPPPDPVCDPPCGAAVAATPPATATATPPAIPAATAPAVTAQPVTARLIHFEVVGDNVNVTIAAGSDQGIDRHWKGELLSGDSSHALAGGGLVLIRIGKTMTVARVKLPLEQVNQNATARLSPP